MKVEYKEEIAAHSSPYFKHEIPVADENSSGFFVRSVQFSPFTDSSDLIAFESAPEFISVYSLKVEGNEICENRLINISTLDRISKIAWSPESNSNTLPMVIKFAVISKFEHDARVIRVNVMSDEDMDDCSQIVMIKCQDKSKTFLNDLAFEPKTGEALACVGDDSFCRIWSGFDGTLRTKFRLTSEGISVKWHPFEPKLLVAEKKGVIRFYSLETKKPFMSFDCNTYPLLSADWCLSNNLFIGCVAGPDVFIWDTSVSSKPKIQSKDHVLGGQKFAFLNENIYATRGRPNSRVRVVSVNNEREIIDEVVNCGDDLSWNFRDRMLAVGSYNKVIIYTLSNLHEPNF